MLEEETDLCSSRADLALLKTSSSVYLNELNRGNGVCVFLTSSSAKRIYSTDGSLKRAECFSLNNNVKLELMGTQRR